MLFHDTGLVRPYRGSTQRFELDSADAARAFLKTSGFSEADADVVWAAIALHTTPEVPYKMAPVIAATTAGVDADVLGMRLDCLLDRRDPRHHRGPPEAQLQERDPAGLHRGIPGSANISAPPGR